MKNQAKAVNEVLGALASYTVDERIKILEQVINIINKSIAKH